MKGYEIHMGESTGDIGLFEIKRLSTLEGAKTGTAALLDGSQKGGCFGTYLHGIFENDGFRRSLLNGLRGQKGLTPLPAAVSYGRLKDEAIDRLARLLREHLDMAFIRRLIAQ